MDFDDFMKGLNNAGSGGMKNLNVDDELAALEKEVSGNKKAKKKERNDSEDLSISDLSNENELSEDDDSEDSDKEEVKKPSKNTTKSPQMTKTKNDAIKTNEIQSKKESEIKSKPSSLKQPELNKKPLTKTVDVYLETTEKIYHNSDKMKSVSVLENELVICDRIIKLKKENGFEDYDIWEAKKNLIGVNITKTTALIKNEAIDVDEYKKKIQNELEYNKKLLNFIPKDKKIQAFEVKEVTERLKERIKIIENELVEEEPEKKIESIEAIKEAEANTKVVTNKKNESKQKEIEKEDKTKDKEKNTPTTTTISPKPPKKDNKQKEEVKKDKTNQSKSNEKLLEIVQNRLSEYKEAIDYFRLNGLSSQLEEAISKAKKIVKQLKLIEEGKSKQIEESSLPDHITPEFICGYSNEERIKQYKEIMEHYLTQINDIKKKMNDMIDKAKSMSKSDQSKIMDKVKKELDNMKNRKAKIERIMQTFKDNAKNAWRPAPLYLITDEEEKIEKINTDIPMNSLLVCLGKTDYTKHHIYANIVIESKTEQVKPKNEDNYDSKSMLTFTQSEFKHLGKKTIEIQIFRKHWYKAFQSDLKGSAEVKLNVLNSKSEVSGNYDIKLLSNRCVPKLEVMLKIRTPFVDKEYDIKIKKSLQVNKILPAFKGDGSEIKTEPSPISKNVIKEQPKQPQPQPQPQPKPSQKPTQHQHQIINDNNTTSKEKEPIAIDKSQFSSDELKNPDVIDNLNTMEVLTFKEKQLNEKIAKIEGRTPKELRDQLVKVKCKKKILEDQLGEGALTPESYIEIINKQHQHDKALHDYFEHENDKEKSSMVASRLTLLKKEMNDMIEYLKENCK